MLRNGVLAALISAQEALMSVNKGWKIKLFDAYRPNAVQAFMVRREREIQAEALGLDLNKLTEGEEKLLMEKVYRIWGIPSEDPRTPPPHSTGAAIDCTLEDENGIELNMGSPIDENSDRSNPEHFAASTKSGEKEAHENRRILNEIMSEAGFIRMASEWWHFSLGDQYWAWRTREDTTNKSAYARYGRAKQ